MNQIAFYGKTTAMQLDFIPPVTKIVSDNNSKRSFIDKPGTLMLTLAKGENKKFDWNNKIMFAIGLNDIPIILQQLSESTKNNKLEIKLVHDPNAGTDEKGQVIKNLYISQGKTPGTYMVGLSMSDNKQYHYLNEGQWIQFVSLLKSITPYMLGFGLLYNIQS